MATRARKTRAAKVAPEDTPEGASGKAREAPSAGSGDGASEAGDGSADEGAVSGTQSAPPHVKLAPQQPEQSSGGTAKPEAIQAAPALDGAASGQAGRAPETGEAMGGGAPAGAAPDADLQSDASDGVIKTAIPATADGTLHELAAPFDPAAFVSDLSDAEKVTLAVWFRNAFPLVFDPALNAVADLAAGRLVLSTGDDTRSFRALSRVKRGGRYYPPGADVPLTRKEHEALKAAGVVAEDWPD